MFGSNKMRMYIIEGLFPDDINAFLINNDINFNMTGFIEDNHRLVFISKDKLKLLKDYLKPYNARIRKV